MREDENGSAYHEGCNTSKKGLIREAIIKSLNYYKLTVDSSGNIGQSVVVMFWGRD